MLQKGDRIPDISLKDQDNNLIPLRSFEEEYPLVIYFYPKDETPGCTREACQFRDQFDEFEALGAKIFGISGDSVSSHQKFIARHSLNFSLLSDPKREAEKAFGVPRTLLGLLPGRVTFVVDTSGIIQYTFNSATQAAKHTKEALNALRKFN